MYKKKFLNAANRTEIRKNGLTLANLLHAKYSATKVQRAKICIKTDIDDKELYETEFINFFKNKLF